VAVKNSASRNKNTTSHEQFFDITDTQYEEISGVVMPGRSVVFGLEFFWHGR